MSDYADILKGSWDNIPEVKALPDGSWLLKGSNATLQAPRDADKSPAVLFVYEPKEPMDDVDQEELEKLGQGYDPSSNRVFVRFYVNNNADWDKVRRHIEKHGLSTKDYPSIEATLKAFKGREIVGHLTTETYQNAAGDMVTQNKADGFLAVDA